MITNIWSMLSTMIVMAITLSAHAEPLTPQQVIAVVNPAQMSNELTTLMAWTGEEREMNSRDRMRNRHDVVLNASERLRAWSPRRFPSSMSRLEVVEEAVRQAIAHPTFDTLPQEDRQHLIKLRRRLEHFRDSHVPPLRFTPPFRGHVGFSAPAKVPKGGRVGTLAAFAITAGTGGGAVTATCLTHEICERLKEKAQAVAAEAAAAAKKEAEKRFVDFINGGAADK